MKRWFKIVLIGLAVYLVGGWLLHAVFFPEKEPEYALFFQANPTFKSKMEGMSITISEVTGDECRFSVVMLPHAKGPVPHRHENFEEIFYVKKGQLTIEIDGLKKQVNEGEMVKVPANTIHRPFNETDSMIVLEHPQMKMPCRFAYSLSRLYSFWDKSPGNSRPPAVLFKLAVLGNLFDSWPSENGPPMPVLKILKVVLAPTARLLGYSMNN
jgi:quercetin dioxygenase-like cupin family protein